MVNPDFDPTDEEEAVLQVLNEEQRANPYLIRERTGLGKGDVNTALTRLTSAGWVEKVTRGLYEYVDDPRDGESGRVRDSEEAPPDSPNDAQHAEQRPHTAEDVDRDQLRDELAGSGELLERRVDEILTMYSYLREHGSAEKNDLLGVADVDTTEYASADSVWANMVKGKDTLRALPGVEPPSTGRVKWKYRPDEDDSGTYDPTDEF